MASYLEVQIISTVICVIAVVSNLITLILCQNARKAEKKSFVLLIQITCFSNVLNSLTGWTVLNRCDQSIYVVCVSYGVGAYLGSRALHLLDCLAIFIDTYIPLLICLMMLFRALILFDHKFKTRTLLAATILVIMAVLPQMYGPVIGYVPVSSIVSTLDPEIQIEATLRTSYGLTMDETNLTIWLVYDKFPIGCFVICVILRFLMQYKLRYYKTTISERSKKIHSGFMNLLTLDASAILIYYLASQTDIFVGPWTSVTTFHYPVFTLPSIIQGVGLLYFVPYLRRSFVKLFKRNQVSPIISSAVGSALQ